MITLALRRPCSPPGVVALDSRLFPKAVGRAVAALALAVLVAPTPRVAATTSARRAESVESERWAVVPVEPAAMVAHLRKPVSSEPITAAAAAAAAAQ
jgi:hypothetical protein